MAEPKRNLSPETRGLLVAALALACFLPALLLLPAPF